MFTGQGFDRHLFALKMIASQHSREVDIFTDPSYAAINHNILSTSTMPRDLMNYFAFAPVVPNGYGISYFIWDKRCWMLVTGYSAKTDPSVFLDSMRASVQELKSVIDKE